MGKAFCKIGFDKIRAFFFDFDGVVADTLGIKTKVFGEIFRPYGNRIMRKVIAYHKNNTGVSRYEKFAYYYKHFLLRSITKRTMHILDRRFSALALKNVIAAPLVPGVLDFLIWARKKGKLCFVVSATPQKEIRKIVRLKRLSPYFTLVLGSPSTKEKHVSDILNRYSLIPCQCLYFGDAKSDYLAARSKRIVFVGIVNHKSQELKGKALRYRIKDFTYLTVGN